MSLLIGAVAALVIGVLAGLFIYQDTGFVVIGVGHWTIQGSLTLFLLLDSLVIALVYLSVRGLVRLGGLGERVRVWQGRRAAARAREALTRGLLLLAEGDWRGAEKSLVRLAVHSETPLLNYLAAARAAQAQGAHERRDHYLNLAHESMPSADVAVSLTQAELQLAHQQLEQALATLMHLRGVAPQHAYVLKLLETLYRRLGDWQSLRDLLPELRRRRVEPEAQLQDLELDIHRALLAQAAGDPDPQRLGALWESMPRSLRSRPGLIQAYVGHEVSRGRGPLVVPMLSDYLRKSWSEELIAVLGAIASDEPARQLAVAEPWLASHPSNPVLLLALGRLCIQASLWGKARGYLEASIGVSPLPETYRELGLLMDRLGEKDKAVECYRAGLELKIAGAEDPAGKRLQAQGYAGPGTKAIAAPVETLVRPGYSA